MVDPHISNKDVVGGGGRKLPISSSSVSAAAVYISLALVISGGARRDTSGQMTIGLHLCCLWCCHKFVTDENRYFKFGTAVGPSFYRRPTDEKSRLVTSPATAKSKSESKSSRKNEPASILSYSVIYFLLLLIKRTNPEIFLAIFN